ncbi:phage tail protein, partial [Clostridium botulinum]|nr:phage tail protein [Clostridium botulinum]NFJ74014.1 phage tail protein [Clostridium botulinum]NFN78804.1 phage tail protein [Clostridium botulinum]NFO79332.1 phage tail protein [Clostridium botulinum]NFS02392.1 phage tail protein [Clostridium botulinum]
MFKFNKICSDDMDLIVESLPSISGPQERIDSTNIPGGTQVLKSTGYDLIDKNCVCHFVGNRFDKVLMW